MIGAIVVTYNPDASVLKTIESLHGQVDLLLVFDNGSIDRTLIGNISSYSKIRIEFSSENIGLAAAYNFGIEYLSKLGCTSYLLSDQDTEYHPKYLENILAATDKFGLGIYGGNVFNLGTNTFKRYEKFYQYHFKKLPITEATLECSIVISSGTYINDELYRKVGRFREDFFIDYVDTEYCMRAGKLRLPIIAVRDAKINHCLGYPLEKVILGKKLIAKNYSIFRRWHIYRNRARCWKMNFGMGFLIWDFTALIYDILLVAVVEDKKFLKLKVSIFGILNGAGLLKASYDFGERKGLL